ncbi:MAG TPA: glycosyltransferase [Puia sp.]
MKSPELNYAPILLFTYKRLDTLKKTISSLRENKLAAESDLIIFSDQGKSPDDKTIVKEVRDYLRTIDGFKSVTIHESLKNKGLANSIIQGVTNIINTYGKVIVLEDDLLTTPNFLTFMNAALEKYESYKKVFSVSGYSFNLGEPDAGRHPDDVYFVTRGWSWGWATWRDRWTDIDWQMKDYPGFATNFTERRKFAQGGSDLNLMLKRQMEGKLDSWAIRWFYHQYKVNGLTLYPILSKVYNDGFDELATHTRGSNLRYKPLLDQTSAHNFSFPGQVAIDPVYHKRFRSKLSIRARIISKSQNLLKRLLK